MPKLKVVKPPKGAKLALQWVDPASLSDNPSNWRLHNEKQKKAVRLSIWGKDSAGWADVGLFNKRTGRLIDGHLRKDLAIERKEPMPVLVGSWTPKQESLILASLDSTNAMSDTDEVKLGALLGSFTDATGDLAELLELVAKSEKIEFAQPELEELEMEGENDEEEQDGNPNAFVKQMQFFMALEVYREVLAVMEAVKAKFRLSNNTDTFLRIIQDARKTYRLKVKRKT